MSVQSYSLPKVSIVLPAYNEENNISSAMSEMAKQTYRNREIIVVDDGSVDSTYERALQFSKGMNDIRIVRTKHGGPSYARNLGVKESSGTVIFFGECDCVYDADYVEKAVSALKKDTKVGAVCLTGAPLKIKSTLATDSIEIENILQHRLLDSGRIKPFYAWVYTKDALEKVGGYDERLFQAEDKDLFGRVTGAGYQIAWVPGINWRHTRTETLPELARKWIKRGRTRVLYSLKNRLLRDLAKSLLPFWAFVLGIVLLCFVPILGALLVVLVILLVLAQSLRTIRITWSAVVSKYMFIGYPLFLLVRNFSTAIGYSFGILKIVIARLEKKEISYKSV